MKPRGIFTITPFENPQESTSYRVTGTKLGGQRIRENFKTQEEALARKQTLEVEALNFIPDHHITTTRLTPAQVAEAELVYAEIKNRPLMPIVRYYQENYREPLKPNTVQKAFDEFLVAKEKAGLREASQKALKCRVGFLVKKFPDKLVSDIQPAHVAEVVAQPGVTPDTKEDNRRSLSSFFSWSMEQGYCLTNPAKKTTRGHGTKDDTEPVILTIYEARRLLNAARSFKGGKLIPYVAMALFAGIRPTELARITWDSVDLEAGTVTIGAKMAKMRQRRIVDMVRMTTKDKKGKETTLPANLLDWLRTHAVKKTPFCGVNWRKDFDAVKELAGFGNPERKPAPDETEQQKQKRKALKPWTQDIMRHTAISNHLAHHQHEGKTAIWAGNSPDIIQRHYKGLVKQTDATEFWSLTPATVKSKIVKLPDAKAA